MGSVVRVVQRRRTDLSCWLVVANSSGVAGCGVRGSRWITLESSEVWVGDTDLVAIFMLPVCCNVIVVLSRVVVIGIVANTCQFALLARTPFDRLRDRSAALSAAWIRIWVAVAFGSVGFAHLRKRVLPFRRWAVITGAVGAKRIGRRAS